MVSNAIELVGMCVGLGLTAFLIRYGVEGLDLSQRIGAALANFAIAPPLLACLVGPFFVRRTRRGLERQLNQQMRDGP